MTSAQYGRSRLRIWKGILDGVGGTSRNGDTLYQTVRKVCTALGISFNGPPTFRQMADAILAARAGIYSADGKINTHLLPQAGGYRRWGLEPDPTFGGSDTNVPGVVFGNPDTGEIIGDPTTGIVPGEPG